MEKEDEPSVMNVSKATYKDMIVARLEELKRLSSETSTPAKAYEQANEVLFQTLLSVAGYLGDDEISEILEEIANTYMQIVEQSGVDFYSFYGEDALNS
jgi:hypothetical protein